MIWKYLVCLIRGQGLIVGVVGVVGWGQLLTGHFTIFTLVMHIVASNLK